MNKYFYSDGQQSFGPYSLDELRALNVVGPTTKIWTAGMTDWAEASTVAETADWFASAEIPPAAPTPPPVRVVVQGDARVEVRTNNPQPSGGEVPERPFSWLAPAIVATVLCCMPFGIVSIVYATKVESRYNMGDYAGAKSAADTAKTWFWWSFGIGAFAVLGWFILMLAGAAASIANGVY